MGGSLIERCRGVLRAACGRSWLLSFGLMLSASGCSGTLDGPQAPLGAGSSRERAATSDATGVNAEGGATEEVAFAPAPAALRKLTLLQYQNSVRDLLAADIKVPEELEPDSSLNGLYAIGAAKATISPSGAEKLESAAYALAAQALDATHRKAFVGCTPSGVKDSACTRQLIARLGRRAFRRPLSSGEAARYLALAEQAQGTLNDFHAGLEYAVAAILQSPHFLFRVELGTERAYDDYEIATRLAYFLWNSTPDAELLDSAERGELSSVEGITRQADRLLASPRAKTALADFHSERLLLGDLAGVQKDASVFKGFDDALRGALRKDVLATIEELTFSADGDFRDLLTSRVAFVDARLAPIYGLSGVTGATRVELPADGKRIGLLGKPAFLALNAHETATSPSKRGKYIREQLLCQGIGAPPPEVVTVLPEPNPNAATMRERLEVHSQSLACAGCHKLMDPIGLSLEHFDAVGRYRGDDNGHALDTSGNLDGADFDGALELSQLLHDDPRASACVARHLYRYAVAHVEARSEEPAIADLVRSFERSGYAFRELVRALSISPGFRQVGEVER